MSSETADATAGEPVTERTDWAGGLLGGAAGALVFGAMMAMAGMRPVLEMAIPAMYGVEGPAFAVGMGLHVFHGAVIGLGFAALAAAVDADSIGAVVGLGAVYGAVVWLVLAALLMPVWLGAVGFPMAPPLPNLNVQSLVGHVVYGVVLGGVYAAYRSR